MLTAQNLKIDLELLGVTPKEGALKNLHDVIRFVLEDMAECCEPLSFEKEIERGLETQDLRWTHPKTYNSKNQLRLGELQWQKQSEQNLKEEFLSLWRK